MKKCWERKKERKRTIDKYGSSNSSKFHVKRKNKSISGCLRFRFCKEFSIFGFAIS